MGQVGFELDEFQLSAFDLIDRGESVLVAAPTGSGKTLVGLYAIERVLKQGAKAYYTTPLKALSNQKYVEFCSSFGSAKVGLLTGDNSIRPDADVVVMTTEVLRNMLYAGSSEIDKLGLVVLDEVHYLQNPYRGGVWEEVIIHLPPTVSLVCLSATVSNAEEFASWMKTVRGSMEAVIEERRPVELKHLYIVGDKRSGTTELLPTFVDGKPNPEGHTFDAPWLSEEMFKRRSRPRAYSPSRVDVLAKLSAAEALPAIYFIFSRNGCDEAVRSVKLSGLRFTSQAERKEIRAIVSERTQNIDPADLEVLGFGAWLDALEAGIAAHHAGMVPPFREAVEACFERSLVRVVFATETLSLGVNMPARSVVIEKLTKFNGERHDLLSPGEYTQLSGRAGRRGIDEVGHCVVVWSPATTFSQAASLASTRSYPITSSFRPNYNMATNLVKGFAPDTVRHLLNLSFAQFRSDSEVVEIEAELARLRRRVDEARREAECGFGDIWDYLDRKVNGHPPQVAGRQLTMPPRVRLDRLRPGDVLAIDDGNSTKLPLVVVLSTGVRSNQRVKILAVSGVGRVHRLTGVHEELLQMIGSVVLPRPYAPSDTTYKKKLSGLLTPFASPVYSLVEPKIERPNRNRPIVDQELLRLEANLQECDDFKTHLNSAKKAQKIQGRISELSRRVRSKLESLAIQFDRVVEILEDLGYVENWQLSEKGERLSRLYAESDLLCSMAMEEGLFVGLGPESLAALVSTLTYEARPQFRGDPGLPTNSVAVRYRRILDLRKSLVAMEAKARIPLTREPDAGFSRMIFRWVQGKPLLEVLGPERLPAGDFIRNAKQLLDLLRQIRDVAPTEEVRLCADKACRMIFRGVVAASSQVYFDVKSLERQGNSPGQVANPELN